MLATKKGMADAAGASNISGCKFFAGITAYRSYSRYEPGEAISGKPGSFNLSWAALIEGFEKSAGIAEKRSSPEDGKALLPLAGSDLIRRVKSVVGSDELASSPRNKLKPPEPLQIAPAGFQNAREKRERSGLADPENATRKDESNTEKSKLRHSDSQLEEICLNRGTASPSLIVSDNLPIPASILSSNSPGDACRVRVEKVTYSNDLDRSMDRLPLRSDAPARPLQGLTDPDAPRRISPESKDLIPLTHCFKIPESSATRIEDLFIPVRDSAKPREEFQVRTGMKGSLKPSSDRFGYGPEEPDSPAVQIMNLAESVISTKGQTSRQIAKNGESDDLRQRKQSRTSAERSGLRVGCLLESPIRDSMLPPKATPLMYGETASARAGIDSFRAADDAIHKIEAHWLQTSAKRAEAEFRDPSLGWVTVRAEAGRAGVHASIIPASEHATQVLDSHISDLKAHLFEAHLQIQELKITQTDHPRSDSMLIDFGGHADSGEHRGQREQSQSRSDWGHPRQVGYTDQPCREEPQRRTDHDLLRASRDELDTNRPHVSLVA